ncbi:hypothetical protein J3A78_002133 [Streptomyces sp. PvR006]|uniref:hypothetical protein n=1 Tax=Streptomyces sp. PvR006 TaxID=2817860 RepID=UPI0027DC872F|nr:hypothetical protein [Streptomyces sp. PvR006]MBP2581655.1 hypothetical protein [Streptomyces sp. PvR006]
MAITPTTPPNPAHQDMVLALEELHRAAGRPSMRRISSLIEEGEHPAVVSHEGVRAALKGLTVPRWETVQSIVEVLAIACVGPPRDPVAEVARFLKLWRAIREGESGGYQSARELGLSQGWGTDDGRWTPEAVLGMMINPFNAIEIHPSLTVPHEPMMTEDEWVRLGLRLVEENGVELALRALLKTLKGDYFGAEEGAPYGYHYPNQEAVDMHTAYRRGCDLMLLRLAVEPNLLQRSIAAMRADETMDREDRIAMLEAESDASLMREVMTVTPETWHEISEEAQLQVFGYLVKSFGPVGRVGLPPEERYRYEWRVPEPTVSETT